MLTILYADPYIELLEFVAPYAGLVGAYVFTLKKSILTLKNLIFDLFGHQKFHF